MKAFVTDFCWFTRWTLLLALALSVGLAILGDVVHLDWATSGSTWQGWVGVAVFWAAMLIAIVVGFREQRRKT